MPVAVGTVALTLLRWQISSDKAGRGTKQVPGGGGGTLAVLPSQCLPCSAQGCCLEPRITHTPTQPWLRPTERSPPSSKVKHHPLLGHHGRGQCSAGPPQPWFAVLGLADMLLGSVSSSAVVQGCPSRVWGTRAAVVPRMQVLRMLLGTEASLDKHPCLLKDVVLHGSSCWVCGCSSLGRPSPSLVPQQHK